MSYHSTRKEKKQESIPKHKKKKEERKGKERKGMKEERRETWSKGV